jgi:hypothetical protein
MSSTPKNAERAQGAEHQACILVDMPQSNWHYFYQFMQHVAPVNTSFNPDMGAKALHASGKEGLPGRGHLCQEAPNTQLFRTPKTNLGLVRVAEGRVAFL